MRIIVTILLTLTLSGCISASKTMVREENVFYLNGKTIELSNELLSEFRASWNGDSPIDVTNKILKASDIQWILDYISINERLSPEECKTLHIIKTRKFGKNEPQINEQNIISGLFDYAWDIDACGSEHTYRIVNKKGESDFLVYPTKL
ncbi:MAG: hypothetical protein OEY06_12175 [Gammaproteobacteria bacterium]|nr:hypothetical protein [Gammaproteobacteria bacterium]